MLFLVLTHHHNKSIKSMIFAMNMYPDYLILLDSAITLANQINLIKF